MEFKKRLVGLRKKKILYQTDVAKKIGVARATYGAYEQGTRQPDFETLEKIADLYDVSTDYLLGRTDNATKQSKFYVDDQEIVLTEEEFILFKELKKHPIMFNDLVSDPEKKVNELTKLNQLRKSLLEDFDES